MFSTHDKDVEFIHPFWKHVTELVPRVNMVLYASAGHCHPSECFLPEEWARFEIRFWKHAEDLLQEANHALGVANVSDRTHLLDLMRHLGIAELAASYFSDSGLLNTDKTQRFSAFALDLSPRLLAMHQGQDPCAEIDKLHRVWCGGYYPRSPAPLMLTWEQ